MSMEGRSTSYIAPPALCISRLLYLLREKERLGERSSIEAADIVGVLTVRDVVSDLLDIGFVGELLLEV